MIGIKPTADPYRVLVVDDQPEDRKVMSQMLESVGFRIREANDGAEAVAGFAGWNPHAVLMDMRMPKMGGAEAIRQIRATPTGQATFILAVSASAFAENRQQALAAGADDFLEQAVSRGGPAGAIARAPGDRVHLGRLADSENARGDWRSTTTLAPGPALAQLPSSLRDELRTAAIHADYDRLMALAEQLARLDAESARILRQTVERFDYQKLIDYVQRGEGHA